MGSSFVVGFNRVWLAAGLVVALTASLLGLASPAGAVAGYGDVGEGTWYTDAVQWSVDNGIAGIAGTCFAPDTPVSRGETAVWIYNMENQPDTGDPHSFSDVSDASQDDAVSWMANNEITTGKSPTTFAPDDTLTRAEAATFLHRLAGKPSAPPHSFVDVVAGWQQGGVSWMADTGITTGTSPTTFAPEDTLTRAHLVTFLYRYQGKPDVTLNTTTPNCDPEQTVEQTVVRYDTGDTIAGFPAGFAAFSGSFSDASVKTTGSAVTVEINDGGSASYTTVTYTCASVGGCTIVNGRVTKGTVNAATGTAIIGADGEASEDPADAGTASFKAVSAGLLHSCAIRADDTITCWGDNEFGQLDVPTGSFKAVSAGSAHSCAIRADDTITCWGDNSIGLLDAPTGDFKSVSAGVIHSCAIRADDTVTCWGDNEFGQLDVPTGSFKAVSAGVWLSCGLRVDGTIICWQEGLLDAPTGSFKAVSSGLGHICAIGADDTITCWGINNEVLNELGLLDAPTGSFKSVSAGFAHSCAIRADGTITCWGDNSVGQLDVPAGSFKSVSAGPAHSCAIRADDTITCWGDNNNGQTDVPGLDRQTDAPDLVVGSPTVDTNAPVAGERFTLSAMVRNLGDGRSASTTLRYYQSVDATISTGDTGVGTDLVSGLDALESGDESVSVTAPSVPGTYYYGACVDSVSDESDTTNNCSTAVTVTVEDALAALVVEPVAGTSTELLVRFEDFIGVGETRAYDFAARAIPGGSWVEACNTFSNTSGRAATGTFSQVFTGLEAGTTYAVRYRYRNSSRCGGGSPGEWSSIAQGTTNDDEVPAAPMVEPVAGTSTELLVRFEDFIGVGETRAYDFAARAIPGGSWVEACNTFSNTSGRAATGTFSQVFTGLEAGTTYAVRYRYRNSSRCGGGSPGEWSSIAQGTTNDDEAAPDLVVDAPTVDTSAPVAGERFTLSAVVRNQGDGRSALTTLRYYRSTDATITTADTGVGTDSVFGLDALESGVESVSVTAPSTPGTYYFGACVDSVSDESDTTNNCSTAVTVTVGAEPTPDLVVGSLTVSDSSPVAGASFTLSTTVRNQGDERSAFTTLRYYRSTDATITSADMSEGTDFVSALDAQESGAESIILTAPSVPGTYYFGACVDSVSDESDTTNNCSAAVTVIVGAATTPDLVVDSLMASNSSPIAGAIFTLSATVRNQGDGPSASTTLFFYRSTDSTITTGDTRVGGTPLVSPLDAHESESKSIVERGLRTPGTYYYGACVNSVWPESDTTNNCSDSVTVTVGAALPPDLVVGSLTVSDSSPVAGAFFTLSATVRNQGHERSASTTLRYYQSTDATITTGDTEVGTDSVFYLVSLETGDELIRVTAPSTPGTYYYGACVDSVSDESDTTNNCSGSVTVIVGGAPTPDLVVGSLTVSDSSPVAGASFTLSATVRNQGDGRSGSTTLRYYRSTDATITTGDTAVGTDSVSGLDALESGDESVSVTASSVPGTYYYGACVDSVSDESDTTTNNCSTAVTVTVVAAPTLELLGDCQNGMKLQAGQGCNYQGVGASEQQITVLLSVRNDGAICRKGGPITVEFFGIPTTVESFEKCDVGGFERDESFGSDITVEKNPDGSWTFHDA